MFTSAVLQNDPVGNIHIKYPFGKITIMKFTCKYVGLFSNLGIVATS